MNRTKIEWTEVTWNPVTGCTPVSEGCGNCYARRMATRLRGRCGYPEDEPFRVMLHPERLDEPLRWRKPLRVFVCSMGDLFHPDVPDEFVEKVFDLMHQTDHTFIVLTKRPERMLEFVDSRVNDGYWGPIRPHIWLGVTVENQARANERIPILLEIPASVRFVSCEPLLGPIDLTAIDLGDKHTQGYGPQRIVWDVLRGWEKQYTPGKRPQPMPKQFPNRSTSLGRRIDWVIVGGETGPNARPMHPDWVRNLRDQCQEAGVPFFFKSWGEWTHEWRPKDVVELTYLKNEEQVAKAVKGGHYIFRRIGKKRAGRLLDGQEWNEHPEVL